MYTYRIKVISVVDGDTLHATIDLGFNVTISATIRFAEINAPEMNTPEGPIVKQFVEEYCAANEELYVQTVKDHKEKFGRYLGYIFTTDPANSLNKMMLDKGMVRLYGSP